MKKMLLIIAMLYAIGANAQTYLINFEGAGAAGTVSTVRIDNLTAGTTLTIDGTETLRLSAATFINDIDINKRGELKIFPNPMTRNSLVQFYPPAAGNARITLFDISGKMLSQSNCWLDDGLQQFRLSGMKQGSYLISIRGGTYQYSGVLLSNEQSDLPVSIEKVSMAMAGNNEAGPVQASLEITGIVDMAYTAGDMLKFTCISGIYTTVVTDVPTQDKTVSVVFEQCTDGDNNNYPVVKIGSQTWMAENLRTTRNSAGTAITSGVYDYNNTPSNALIYGKLYTWVAIMAGSASSNTSPSGVTGICPTGWHIPSLAEWTTLTSSLGGLSVAGGKLKSTGTALWTSPNTGATNGSGFSGVPGGFIGEALNFGNLGKNGYYWSSTEYLANNGYNLTMVNTGQAATLNYLFKTFGFSCRCVKD